MPSMTHAAGTHTVATALSARLRWSLLVACVCLIIYVTLFPFSGWRAPVDGWWTRGVRAYHDISSPDTLANVLLYMPLGFLLILGRRMRVLPLIVLGACVFSLGLETAQASLPGRVSSLLDTLLNASGAGIGAAVAPLLRWPRFALGHHAVARLRADRVAWIGIAALGAWACAQLIPFVPSLDISNLKDGLKPLWHALQGAQPIRTWRILVYLVATAALVVCGATSLRISRIGGIAALFLLAILPLKVLVIGRQLSAEAFFGTLAGVAVGIALWALDRRRALIVAALAIPIYVVAAGVEPGLSGTVTHAFNWVPLSAQVTQPLNGLANLADQTWPWLVFACLCLRLDVRPLWVLLPMVALLLIGVAWVQCMIPGRYPDITTILVGIAAWIAAAAYADRHGHPHAAPAAD